MAEHIAGSESEFVTRMNELAQRLGMQDTNYVNCTGLPAADNYSCAADVAKVYQYLMRSPYYSYKSNDTPINLTWMYDLTHPSGRVTGLTNTNKHARFFNGCVGGKTGFTQEAVCDKFNKAKIGK
jgi:D-alanyl-D-alanine carboxypeptidase (penicillin-binding protein 5/6)